MSVIEVIHIDDSSTSSSQPVLNMEPRSFSRNHPSVTSNTSSKRKLRSRSSRQRQRQHLPLAPVSSSTRSARNHNKKGQTTAIKRKRKRDPNQPSIKDTFSTHNTRQLANGRVPAPMSLSHSHYSNPRRSARIQNKTCTKRRKLNIDNPPVMIDLSNEHNDDDDTSNSSQSNHKMSMDDASDDVELIQEDNDVDMQDITVMSTNMSNNKHNTNTVVDLEDDDDIDIDINDIELRLFGVAIGKHQDFWNCKEEQIQPAIIMNKHTNTIQIRLRSIHGGHYVSVSIKTSEIKALYLPENPSIFSIDKMRINPSLIDDAEEELSIISDKKITPYLQIMFIQTKAPLGTYQWLSEHYNPNDMTHPGIERITFVMGCKEYQRFKTLVMNKSFFCELRNVVSIVPDDEKDLWIKNLYFARGTKRAWKKYDTQCTKGYIEKLVGSDHDTEDNQEEEEECKAEDAIDITESQANDLDSEIDGNEIDDSGDFSEYIANEEIILNPHHSNSLIYAKTRKSEPSKTLECYWVFPAQHEHRQSIMHIETKDYSLVCTEDEYLNDTIIDFQLKYTYASWPCRLKEKVYIFTSFFWKKLMKIRKHNPDPQDIKQMFRWSKRIKSLFDKQYIIIPKCDHNHWELVIVAYPGKVLKRYLKSNNDFNGYHDPDDVARPCITILDSLLGRSKSSEFAVIRKWLNLEAKQYIQRMRDNEGNSNNKQEEDDDIDQIFSAKTITGYIVKVPRQPNGHDCGCFLLRNVLQFGIDEGFKDTSNKKNINLADWYDAKEDGVGYRQDIASNLARLIKEQKAINTKLRLQHTNRKKQMVREQIQKRKRMEMEKNANNFQGYEPS